jgi:hypothetical protein
VVQTLEVKKELISQYKLHERRFTKRIITPEEVCWFWLEDDADF